MKRYIPILTALGLVACSSTTGTLAITPADAQQAWNDACWAVKTAEASFVAFNSKGAIDPAGVKTFNQISAETDAICAGPIPTDTKQVVTKLMIGVATMAALIVPPAS